MEKYDAGLRIIATAQQAREAGDYVQAHAQFIQGIEELMRLVQSEGNAETKTLVRKHCARFMDEAEQILTAQPSPPAAGRGIVAKVPWPGGDLRGELQRRRHQSRRVLLQQHRLRRRRRMTRAARRAGESTGGAGRGRGGREEGLRVRRVGAALSRN